MDGLNELVRAVDIPLAGGEYFTNTYEPKEYLVRGAHDILTQVIALGDVGVTGLRKLAATADMFHTPIAPHISPAEYFPPTFAATLQVAATVGNYLMVEYPYDPPILTAENQQAILKQPIRVETAQ